MTKKIYKKTIGEVHIEWDQTNGICTYNDIPVLTMWLNSTFIALLEAMRQMVGEKRVLLALQQEGRNSIEDDWNIIKQAPSFEQGIKKHSDLAALGGWGRNELISIDYKNKTAIMRNYNSAEGRANKASGLHFQSALIAGKFVGWCEKVFETPCWPTQTKFISAGDNYDEFVIKRSSKNIETEIQKLLYTSNAAQADMAIAIRKLKKEIKARKKIEKKVNNLAFYDMLTGLPNRRHFYQKIQLIIKQTKLDKKVGALLLLDVDKFKLINDLLGHDAGDLALKITAERLLSTTKKYDEIEVARLGGDEFVIAILCNDKQEAKQAAIEIAENIKRISKISCDINGIEQYLNYSIGITLIQRKNANRNLLLKQADIALYQTKNFDRGNYTFFTRKMHNDIALKDKMHNELRDALKLNQFFLNFQPIYNTNDQLVACEALIRWKHPKRGVRPAAEFMPEIQSCLLSISMGKIVIKEAFHTLRRWIYSNVLPKEFDHLSINISPVHFTHPAFISYIKSMLEETNIPPSMIMFEITESSMITDFEKSESVMEELIALGFRFSIDDYGTGYSSLSYLHQLPFSELKIDKSFVLNVTKNSKDKKIINSLISLANQLDMTIVAEGVENKQQLEYLKENGCKLYQGYYLGHPVNHEDFIQHT